MLMRPTTCLPLVADGILHVGSLVMGLIGNSLLSEEGDPGDPQKSPLRSLITFQTCRELGVEWLNS